MTIACDPIRPDELDGLFAPLLEAHAGEGVALAVSGGSDSTALMVLFADWLRQHGADPAAHAVLTVDHRLRPESAAEAETVARLAAKLGFPHATLAWEGPKPQSGLQAAAREARYRLIGDHLRARATPTLLTAHTRDDQAETLLMRLARGSGLDGLAGIAPAARLGSLLLLRPLLDTPKARLRATLEARRIPWIEDPSNQSPAFERTRLRAAGDALAALGLTGDMLALSARRLLRARTALDSIADSFCGEPEGAIHTDPCGFFRIDRERLGRVPEEIALRVLARCIAAAGGSEEPVPLGKLESIVVGVRRGQDPKTASWTLARALITAAPDAIQVEREPGRQPLPHLTLTRGRSALWDGRFAVAMGVDLEGTVVRALGAEGLAELRRLGRAVKGTRALQMVPSFWRESTLIAVPALDFWANPDLAGQLSADFVGLRYNSGVPDGGQSGEFGPFY